MDGSPVLRNIIWLHIRAILLMIRETNIIFWLGWWLLILIKYDTTKLFSCRQHKIGDRKRQ